MKYNLRFFVQDSSEYELDCVASVTSEHLLKSGDCIFLSNDLIRVSKYKTSSNIYEVLYSVFCFDKDANTGDNLASVEVIICPSEKLNVKLRAPIE